MCQAMELPFLDAAGNAFLTGDGLYVLVTGQKADKTRFQAEKPMRAFDRAGLRVVFALLAAPTMLQAPYRDVAKAAGVPSVAVGHGFYAQDALAACGPRAYAPDTAALRDILLAWSE